MTDSDEVKLLPCELIAKVAEILDDWPDLPDTASTSGLCNDLTFGDLRALLALARPPVVTDEVVERLREAVEYLDAMQEPWFVIGGRRVHTDDLRKAIASMPAVVSGGQSHVG